MSEAERTTTFEDMAPRYDPAAAQARWYPLWIERGYFRAAPNPDRTPYCIVLPPPNVTGALHVGHALGHTLMDALTRRKRMQGYVALWLPGTDHAGIATQVLVERQLRDEGIESREMGREAFIERVWQWKERYGGRIVEQMKSLGDSCDWDRLRFTMDEGLTRAVRVAFVRMYEDGLIYRGERIINWCPTDRTALSDSEVEHREVEGELITFRYLLTDGSGFVDVATTRVETMLGDTGVAVHQDDGRYRDIVGKTLRHPFTGADLPVVADEAVDPSFGTGAVKITPAHDQGDFDIAERAGLPRLNILNADGTISEAAPPRFRGLDRYAARAAVREGLAEEGLLIKEERPYPHVVGHCYRCESEIEPWLSGQQWFVAVERLTGPAKEAVEDGRVRFFPERWRRNYVEWLDNLRDWNISRQLWWGHRIPVWYCPDGHEFSSVEDPETCRYCGRVDIEQDPDVLDTWFSSQLWPFSTLGWPDDTSDLDYFYPTSVLVTGYEILYLWVARMIMSGLYLMDDVPFRHAVIHGLVRDRIGRKMSKSLGNVLDPLDMIERYGADALRFSLMRLASGGQQDIPFGEEAVEAGQHFANKIWNAARLILSSYPGGPPPLPSRDRLTAAERWLLSRHQACLEEVDSAFDEYRFSDGVQAIHRFLWSEFCDWGLELEKGRLQGTEDERSDAVNALAWILERTVRLLHPVMPFVTEEVWQRLGVGESIVIAEWPDSRPDHIDREADSRFASVREMVSEIRGLLALLPPGMVSRVVVDESRRSLAGELSADLRRLTGVEIAFAALDGATARLDLPPDLDLGPIIERKRRRLQEVRDRLARSRAKLANEGFLSKAAPEVVAAERNSAVELEEQEEALLAELVQLGAGPS
jgi:valyl-tRNA synthetase